MVSFGVGNVIGLLGLLSLIPLILLYLIRPRAKEIDVPSLMFFQKDQKRKQERAFFQRMKKDWLFWLQLLGLLALSLFFAQPYLVLDKGLSIDESIIVLDVSASTGVGNVFGRAVDEARSVVGKKNTLIMVGASPYVALDKADKKTTMNFLDDVHVGAVASSLGQALTLAGQYAVGAAPEIFVISDFMDTGTISFDSARETLANRGVKVHLVDVGEEKAYSNIGIIQVKPRADVSEMIVKNFNDAPQQITAEVNGQIKNLNLEPLGTQVISFASKLGVNEVRLNVNDDLAIDNIAYVSIPYSKKVRVLLLSDSPSRYLKAALTSISDIELDVTASLPSERYDVYILQGITTMSQQEVQALEQYAREGASVVIYAQQDMQSVNYGNLLPVTLGEKLGYAPIEEAQSNKFTQGVVFGGVQQHFVTRNEQGVTLLRGLNSSLLTLYTLDEGKVVYYGIMESASDFALNPGYPIFWVNFVRYLGNARTITDVNRQGGNLLTYPEKVTIQTPSRSVHTNMLYLHEPGVYTIEEDHIVVNLAHEKESQLLSVSAAEREQRAAQQPEGVKQHLGTFLLWGAIVLVFLELLLTKGRGEM